MSDGDKREFLFLSESVIKTAQSQFEIDKRRDRRLDCSFLNQSFSLLTTSGYDERGYLLIIFGKSVAPDILFYSNNKWIEEIYPRPAHTQATYLLRLLGVNSGDYSQLWHQGGALFLIGEEPDNVKKERLHNELGRSIRASGNDSLKLHFIAGIPLFEVFLPKDFSDDDKERLIHLLLDYQLRTDHQAILANLSKDDPRLLDEYYVCENERNRLFSAIRNLGWSAPRVNNQAVDINFREWNAEKGKWNIHMVDAFFIPVKKIGKKTK